MTATTVQQTERSVLDGIKGFRDDVSARRVFGDPVRSDDVTIIPVARIAGGGGGGGGEGTGPDDENGRGFGTGFGLGANPVGVYIVKNGEVEWKPTIDVNRLAKGGQVLSAIIAICITLIVITRRR